jgi:hypothetical protein
MKSGLGSRHSVQNDSVQRRNLKWGLNSRLDLSISEKSAWAPVIVNFLPFHLPTPETYLG